MALTFGELFAGIGGISLGLERAGMIPKWHVELDDYATIILEKHWPHVARYRDVHECGKHNLEPVDVIAGGFPCQDVSLAGKRQGLEGERTTLWGEFARIIGELRPRWVVAENVPGLLSSDDGRFFGNVLRDLAALGYDAEWDCIPAAAVGAPHRRDRVFVVAYPNCQGVGQQHVHAGTWADADGLLPNVADAKGSKSWQSDNQQGRQGSGPGGRDCRGDQEPANKRKMAHAARAGARGVFRPRWWQPQQSGGDCWGAGEYWATEPDVGRVADGVSHRVDRLRCLGNAVVPAVAEYIGRCIINAEPNY